MVRSRIALAFALALLAAPLAAHAVPTAVLGVDGDQVVTIPFGDLPGGAGDPIGAATVCADGEIPFAAGGEWTCETAGTPTLGANLTAIDGLTTAANQITLWTGSGTAAQQTLSANMLSFIDDADFATMRATLGLTIGTNVQAWNAGLSSIAALTTTAFGRGLLEAANAAALRAAANAVGLTGNETVGGWKTYSGFANFGSYTIFTAAATLDASLAATYSHQVVGSLPADCGLGQTALLTTADDAQQFHVCTSLNDWTQQGGGGIALAADGEVDAAKAANAADSRLGVDVDGTQVPNIDLVSGGNIAVTKCDGATNPDPDCAKAGDVLFDLTTVAQAQVTNLTGDLANKLTVGTTAFDPNDVTNGLSCATGDVWRRMVTRTVGSYGVPYMCRLAGAAGTSKWTPMVNNIDELGSVTSNFTTEGQCLQQNPGATSANACGPNSGLTQIFFHGPAVLYDFTVFETVNTSGANAGETCDAKLWKNGVDTGTLLATATDFDANNTTTGNLGAGRRSVTAAIIAEVAAGDYIEIEIDGCTPPASNFRPYAYIRGIYF